MSTPSEGASGSEDDFALDNLTYDLITILHEKSRALAAYVKYLHDAEGDQEITSLLQQLRRRDYQHIQQIERVLAQQLGSRGRPATQGVSPGSTHGTV